MPAASIRRWSVVHKWTSLVCTLFLLMLCVTGLPLIFQDELEAWLTPGPTLQTLPSDTPKVSVDRVVEVARRLHPQEIVTSIGLDDDAPLYLVVTEPPAAASGQDIRRMLFDARTARLIEDGRAAEQRPDVMLVIYQLHFQMFAGLPGRLFLGAMALIFVAAIVSGIVLYGPFTRRLDFGEVRSARGRRVRWLDLHNLLGIVVAAWSLIVGLTGAMNTIAQPLYAHWQAATIPPLLGERANAVPRPTLSAQQAISAAEIRLPGYAARSIFFPADRGLASPRHYLVWLKGATPLTSKLLEPVLVDAQWGTIPGMESVPWYLRVLDLSRPLHFGDYGGAPLKIIWALLDVVTIVVLGSGLYLWIARHRRERAAPVREALHGASPVMEPAE